MIIQFRPKSQAQESISGTPCRKPQVFQFKPKQKPQLREPMQDEITQGFYEYFNLTQAEIKSYAEQAAAHMLKAIDAKAKSCMRPKGPVVVVAQCARCEMEYKYVKGTNAKCPSCGARGKRSITVVTEEK